MSVRLPRKAKLGALFKYKQNNAFLTTPASAHLAVGNVKLQKKNIAKGLITAAAAIAAFSGVTQKPTATTPALINPSLKYVMSNGIIVYGTPDMTSQIAAVAEEFPKVQKDQGATIDIPENE